MNDLFVALFVITTDGIREVANRRISPNTVNRFEGFEFRMLYNDVKFFQCRVYAYNIYATQVLHATVDNCGFRIGGQYDTPILIKTVDGFTGVLCTYIIVISQSTIDSKSMLNLIGIDSEWKVSADTYSTLKEKCAHFERICGFAETMNYIQRQDEYSKSTSYTISHTKVYDEGFFSSLNPNKETAVSFQENLTLLAGKDAVAQGKRTAVLNFANPIEPGGGVLRGAKAQEENICRSSNLYKSLTSEKASEYYQSNKNILTKNQFNSMFLGTDKVIYSPGVLVLKEDVNYQAGFLYSGNEQYVEQPFTVDVLTCAAPFFSGSGYILPDGDLQHVFERRIRNVLEAAIDNEVEVIILGAFGCGAFHNPVNVVADAFREVLLETRYRTAFDKIIFAVKRTDIICPNIEAFERNFASFPEKNHRGIEKQHRDLWKWTCDCGLEHPWDADCCDKCNNQRRRAQKITCYNR